MAFTEEFDKIVGFLPKGVFEDEFVHDEQDDEDSHRISIIGSDETFFTLPMFEETHIEFGVTIRLDEYYEPSTHDHPGGVTDSEETIDVEFNEFVFKGEKVKLQDFEIKYLSHKISTLIKTES